MILQTSFLELVKEALSDFTVLILLASGLVSLALGLTVDKSDAGWIEGAAILVAVAVVVLVTATNDFQKEKQFRELNKMSEGGQVSLQLALASKHCSVLSTSLRLKAPLEHCAMNDCFWGIYCCAVWYKQMLGCSLQE